MQLHSSGWHEDGFVYIIYGTQALEVAACFFGFSGPQGRPVPLLQFCCTCYSSCPPGISGQGGWVVGEAGVACFVTIVI